MTIVTNSCGFLVYAQPVLPSVWENNEQHANFKLIQLAQNEYSYPARTADAAL